MTKADWLRNEIKKLEGMKFPEIEGGSEEMPYTEMITADPTTGEVFQQFFYNQALTTIITRYKEELLELDRREV